MVIYFHCHFEKNFRIAKRGRYCIRILQEIRKRNKCYINFVQSKSCKNKIPNFESKEVFPILLFSDDYTAGNPLVSHSSDNKLAGTYITIPSLEKIKSVKKM